MAVTDPVPHQVYLDAPGPRGVPCTATPAQRSAAGAVVDGDTLADHLLSSTRHARVITPTHPGFGGTPRPDALRSIAGLAALYAALLDRRDLHDVTIVGNSIGGWIAAELALLDSTRISNIVLVDAAGIEVPDHPIADFFSLTMDQAAGHRPPPADRNARQAPATTVAVRRRPRHQSCRPLTRGYPPRAQRRKEVSEVSARCACCAEAPLDTMPESILLVAAGAAWRSPGPRSIRRR
ncbi:MAG TPA: alpha/beta fold hydrolase [Chloroflexota bacterium]|nr:alpha/beta fold hydrolase [Chloroflexota bacterium]